MMIMLLQRVEPRIPEMMDRDDNDPELLWQDLKNLRILNRLFGGYTALQRHFIPFFSRIASHRAVRVLDLATGSADHPVRLVELARKMGRSIEITAIDRHDQILAHARERVQGYPEITLSQADMRSLNFPPASFDIVLCSLALHHLETPDAIAVVREMYRLSTIGFIVNDLSRSVFAAWVVRLFTEVTMRNPLTLNDSYASVLRAFTSGEMSAMASAAGVPSFRIYRHAFFRLVLVGEH
jgi:ubiquinone/menaquinone biosynthesis C-methylase UbiE